MQFRIWLFVALAHAMVTRRNVCHRKVLITKSIWCTDVATVHTIQKVQIVRSAKIFTMICHGSRLWENKLTLAKVIESLDLLSLSFFYRTYK